MLNKIRYNSICIKGVNSHYFPVISIYFMYYISKLNKKKTVICIPIAYPLGTFCF